MVNLNASSKEMISVWLSFTPRGVDTVNIWLQSTGKEGVVWLSHLEHTFALKYLLFFYYFCFVCVTYSSNILACSIQFLLQFLSIRKYKTASFLRYFACPSHCTSLPLPAYRHIHIDMSLWCMRREAAQIIHDTSLPVKVCVLSHVDRQMLWIPV